jgi:hypothetical protein
VVGNMSEEKEKTKESRSEPKKREFQETVRLFKGKAEELSKEAEYNVKKARKRVEETLEK